MQRSIRTRTFFLRSFSFLMTFRVLSMNWRSFCGDLRKYDDFGSRGISDGLLRVRMTSRAEQSRAEPRRWSALHDKEFVSEKSLNADLHNVREVSAALWSPRFFSRNFIFVKSPFLQQQHKSKVVCRICQIRVSCKLWLESRHGMCSQRPKCAVKMHKCAKNFPCYFHSLLYGPQALKNRLESVSSTDMASARRHKYATNFCTEFSFCRNPLKVFLDALSLLYRNNSASLRFSSVTCLGHL